MTSQPIDICEDSYNCAGSNTSKTHMCNTCLHRLALESAPNMGLSETLIFLDMTEKEFSELDKALKGLLTKA